MTYRHDFLHVVFVTSLVESDRLLSLFGEIAVRTQTLRGCTELRVALSTGRHLDAVLTDESFQDGCSYLDVIRETRSCGVSPSIVVCLQNPTPQLIHTVFESGATDCLIPPYIHTEVRRTLEVAAARTMMGI